MAVLNVHGPEAYRDTLRSCLGLLDEATASALLGHRTICQGAIPF